MSGERVFHALQAVEVARVFREHSIDYLFIGKSGAILLGYPATTQDLDLFPQRSPENCRRLVAALAVLGFEIDDTQRDEIARGKDFVQLKTGPFDLDLVFAPDGIASFESARARRIMLEEFPVANLRDIIASKRASARQKDLIDVPLLEKFADEYERLHPKPLRSAWEIDRDNLK